MPFVHKQLAATFDLGEGDFGSSGVTRVKLSGPLRASALITEAGGPSFGQLELSLFGMTLSNMNKLSTLGQKVTLLRKNVVTLEAGDTNSGLATVFQGQIRDGWADFTGMPQVVFRVTAFAGLLEAIKPIPPTTISGLADVVVVLKGLANQADPALLFTNDGVTSKLIDPYFPGTIYEQIRRCAEAAQINWVISNRTLAIWPRDGARGQVIPVISPSTGMVGYPSFTQTGIQVTTVYTPSINFGQKIKVESSLAGACGEWIINTLSHNLESETPGGQWFTRFTAAPPGIAVISR